MSIAAAVTCACVLAVPPSEPAPPGFVPSQAATARWIGPGVSAGVGMTFSVTLEDPQGNLAGVASGVQACVLAAAERWAQFIDRAGEISIVVRSASVPRATGRSATTGFVATRDGYDVFEQGWAYEARTGQDPNGPAYDIEIELGTGYAVSNLWYDPAPTVRTAPIPQNRTDAVSVFLHEMGHALAFNGWLSASNGSLPGNYRSPTDELTSFSGVPYFNGARATQRYGAPVPMTLGNWCHFGNAAPGPGSSLIPDLMNGVVFYYQTRYDLTPLDLDLCRDVGVSILDACGPADVGMQGGLAGSDGVLNNNDFIAFITLFFAGSAAADLGVAGGSAGHDGVFDNNDFIAFITLYFAGC